jgi:hypothetical protein
MITLKIVLLICSVVSFALNAFGVTTKVNLDALGKAFFVASLLA